MTENMKIMLTTQPADSKWGKNAIYSIDHVGVKLHLNNERNHLNLIQHAARKIDDLNIKYVELFGNNWNIEYCWAFWMGYKNPKKESNRIKWPILNTMQRNELDKRLNTIDWVRDLINTPSEDLGPNELVDSTINLLCGIAEKSISYQIIKGNELYKKKYLGLHAVGRGSLREPVLLKLDFNPTPDIDSKIYACLVAKGITFDSGGYSIKKNDGMDIMKSDMGGAAILTGALAFAILHGLNKRVKLWLCCAENLISGGAIKLGDIIHYRNGKTVEITNTDAEGRLILADGLIDASEYNPELIIDAATLTGAAKIALGDDYHAIFSFDDNLVNRFMSIAKEENELFWRLPLAEFHRNQLPSSFAKLSNTSIPIYSAGASTAAAFLSHFIKNYQNGWMHIDCSAAYRKIAIDQWSAGATGVGVRTIANLLLGK